MFWIEMSNTAPHPALATMSLRHGAAESAAAHIGSTVVLAGRTYTVKAVADKVRFTLAPAVEFEVTIFAVGPAGATYADAGISRAALYAGVAAVRAALA